MSGSRGIALVILVTVQGIIGISNGLARPITVLNNDSSLIQNGRKGPAGEPETDTGKLTIFKQAEFLEYKNQIQKPEVESPPIGRCAKGKTKMDQRQSVEEREAQQYKFNSQFGKTRNQEEAPSLERVFRSQGYIVIPPLSFILLLLAWAGGVIAIVLIYCRRMYKAYFR